MAIDWDGANGLFTKLGKIVRLVEVYDSFQESNFDLWIDLIAAKFSDSDEYDRQVLSLLFDLQRAVDSDLAAMREQIAQAALPVIRGELEAEAVLGNVSDVDVWDRLWEEMKDGSETLNPRATTAALVGSTLNCSTLLAAYQPYVHGIPAANTDHLARQSRRDITLECVDDRLNASRYRAFVARQSQGSSPGSYLWDAYQDIVDVPVHYAADRNNLVPNGGFEEVASNEQVPGRWSILGGSWGSSGSAYVVPGLANGAALRNGRSLFLNSGIAGVYLEVPLDPARFTRDTTYAVSIWSKKEAAGTSFTGSVVVRMNETDNTLGFTTAVLSSTSWVHSQSRFNVVNRLDSIKLIIVVTDLSTAGGYLDEIQILPMPRVLGWPMLLIANNNDPARENRDTLTMTALLSGKFSTFFARFFGVELPNKTTSPSIADSLVA